MRGEVWTVAASGYASKPRPAVVVQSDACDRFDSVLMCMVTSREVADEPLRVPIAPSAGNGLAVRSWVMADKVGAIPKRKLGERIGALSADDMAAVEAALRASLGL